MKYDANDIVSLSQGRAYRDKIGMYLSADRQEAINLGLRELVVNVQDEYEVYKPANPFVHITLDTKTKVISVADNMRGIPVGVREDGVNSLTAAMLIAHSGGKHQEGSYVSSVGINGVGAKVVCHTAKWLEVEVKRDGNTYTQRFESTIEGAEPVTEVLAQPNKSKETGTKITYVPDPLVYGDLFVDADTLEKMLTELAYFARGLSIVLVVDGKSQTFLSKNGLLDGLNTKGRLGDPMHFFWEEEGCQVELALQWTKSTAMVKGYANGLYMPDGGAFITGFRSSLTRVFNRLANKSFTGDQIRSVLEGFVSVKVKVGQFSNQSKTALANTEARTATSSAIMKALEEFYNRNRATFDQVVDLLSKVERADEAAQKAREAVLTHIKQTTEAGKKKIILADKLKDCRVHGENAALVITEGDSALGSLASARDVEHTALYPIRGKIKNALRAPIDEVLENKEVNDIILALGAGIQDRYNGKKLRYGSIWIATDADADGYAIMTLIATMFYVLMPKFIEEGRLKWLRAPLFRIGTGKNAHYAYNTDDLEKLKQKGTKGNITRFKGLGEMNVEDIESSMFGAEQRVEVLTYGAGKEKRKAELQLEGLMGEDVDFRRNFIFDNIDFDLLRD